MDRGLVPSAGRKYSLTHKESWNDPKKLISTVVEYINSYLCQFLVYYVEGFPHISESQCDPSTKFISRQEPLVKIEMWWYYKNSRIRFWQHLTIRFNELTFDPCHFSHPSNKSCEREFHAERGDMHNIS